jgi:hypothetical protein
VPVSMSDWPVHAQASSSRFCAGSGVVVYSNRRTRPARSRRPRRPRSA